MGARAQNLVSALLPLQAVIRKDVVVYLRKVRTFVTLLIALAVAALFIYTIWPPQNFVTWQTIRMFSTTLINVFAFGALFAGALIVPGIAAGGFIAERERGAWDMLSITLIQPWTLVLGKLAAALFAFFILLIGCAPVVATVFFMLGVDPSYFLYAGAIITTTLTATGALGCAVAAWTRKSVSSLRGAYAVSILFMGLYLVPIYVTVAFIEYFRPDWIDESHAIFTAYLPSTVPPMMLASRATGGWVNLPLTIFFGWQAFWIAASLLLAYAGVRRRRMVRDNEWGVVTAKGTSSGHRRSPFRDRLNPVAVREWKWGLFAKRRGFWMWLLMVSGVLIGISLLFLLSMRSNSFKQSGTEEMIAIVLLHGAFLLASIPAALGNIVTKEKERATGILLATTSQTALQLLWGKLSGAMRLAVLGWFISLFANALFAVQLFLEGIDSTPMFQGHVTLLATVLCMTSITVYASTRQKKTTAAISLAGFLGFLVFFGVAALVFLGWIQIVDPFFSGDFDERAAARLIFPFSPVTAYISILAGPAYVQPFAWLANLGYLAGFTVFFVGLAYFRMRKCIKSGFEV